MTPDNPVMAPDAELADLPARVAAGEHVVLRPSKRRKLGSLVLALWAAFLVAAGVGTLDEGLFSVVLLVLALPACLYWLVVAMPRSGALTLTRQGFEVRHAWITRHWDWDRITGFTVRHIHYPRAGGIELVGFATRDARDRPGDPLQKLAIRGLTRTTTLPDRFGKRPHELAETMSRCRLRFSDRSLVDSAIEIDAGEEIRTTAATSGTPEELADRIVEARYDYLEQHPRDRVVQEAEEHAWVARRTDEDADTVGRVLHAHDDFLRRAGVMRDLKRG